MTQRSSKGSNMIEKPIALVIKEHRASLLSMSGILGIGQGGSPKEPHITVYVQSKNSDICPLIPSVLEGYPVVIKETGDIEAL